MKLHLQKHYPVSIYASIGGVIFFIFSIITFYRILNLPRVDSPSSTDSIAYVFASIYSVLFFAGGLICGIVLGKIIEFLISKFLGLRDGMNIFISCLLLVIAILFFSYYISSTFFEIAKKQNSDWNEKNALGIKLTEGIIKRIDKNNLSTELRKYDLAPNYNHVLGYIGGLHFEKKKKFQWNGKTLTILFDDTNHIFIKNEDGTTFIDYNLKGYNYINGITYLTFSINNKESYLFVLSRLRATSHQSLLAVFTSAGILVYEELMEASNMIEIAETSKGEKVIIVGNIQPVYNKEPCMYLHDFYYRIK